METENITICEPLIEVTNNYQQNVKALLTPNIMFINKPQIKNKKTYYRIIIWFDYLTINSTLTITKDLLIQNLQFELFVKSENNLVSLDEKGPLTKPKLLLSFDDQQRRIIHDNQEYLTYFIEDKYLVNESFDLTYNLNFSSCNYSEFLNSHQIGENRGKILINPSTKSKTDFVEIPEATVYLANDSWQKKSQVVYPLLVKKYYLTSYPINYLNQTNKLLFKIDLNILKQIPLAILTQQFLRDLLYDLEKNLTSDDIFLENLELASTIKLEPFYNKNILEYKIKRFPEGIEVYLVSQWDFNPDLKMIEKSAKKHLFFNPLVAEDQWINLNFTLTNKPFNYRINLTTQKITIVDQAKKTDYYFDKQFQFQFNQPLTYQKYLEFKNENETTE